MEISTLTDIQKLVLQGYKNWGIHGRVTVREYDGLLIFNYNVMAQFEGTWNFFEVVSRGLIIDPTTGEIVARPFDKFFNWLEGNRTSTGQIIAITEKVDGSLGILYRHRGQYHIATRGSLNGEQALWATSYLRERYKLDDLDESLTLLFEIIYPENRIIVDYSTREDLVLLAARNRFTGEYLPFVPDVQTVGNRYGFTLPQIHGFDDVPQLIRQLGHLDESREGYVVEFSDGKRFKFKGARYLELHKLITSLSFKNILKAMQNNSIDTILETVPDEFLGDVRGWIKTIEETIADVTAQVESIYAQAPKTSRKDFAIWVMQDHRKLSHYLFALWDEDDLTPIIYSKHDWDARIKYS